MPKVIFVTVDGERREIEAAEGLSVMTVARDNGLGVTGDCNGSLACATCHMVVDPAWYGRLNQAEEREEDILDLAHGLTRTSRLGCQIKLSEALDGLVVTLLAPRPAT